jgi:Asp-tRNA(Asn)/Glu-tRNA(Gln) amidotransferase A subunit family amidase
VIVDDLLFSPITEQASAVRSRRLSPVELTRAYLDRIAKLDATLRAFITVDGDGALAAARTLEREAAAGAWRGPLHGVRSPTRTSAGSRVCPPRAAPAPPTISWAARPAPR